MGKSICQTWVSNKDWSGIGAITIKYEPVCEKTNNLGSDQVQHKPGYSHRRWLEAGNFGFRM